MASEIDSCVGLSERYYLGIWVAVLRESAWPITPRTQTPFSSGSRSGVHHPALTGSLVISVRMAI
jgi:hypothetical protein